MKVEPSFHFQLLTQVVFNVTECTWNQKSDILPSLNDIINRLYTFFSQNTFTLYLRFVLYLYVTMIIWYYFDNCLWFSVNFHSMDFQTTNQTVHPRMSIYYCVICEILYRQFFISLTLQPRSLNFLSWEIQHFIA